MEIAKGNIISATPFLDDPYFRQAVVLLTEHNDKGSFGFIINRETDLKLHELIKDVLFEASIYYGGPVGNENLFYIHSLGDLLPNSVEILPGLYWGGEFDVLKELLNNKEAEPDKVKFFAGYSGWDPEQLAGEFANKAWVAGTTTAGEVLHTEGYEQHWKKMLRKDKEYAIWSNFTDMPHLN